MNQNLPVNRNKILQKCFCVKYGNTYLWKLPRQARYFVVGKHWYGVIFTMIVIAGGTLANLRFLNKLRKDSPIFANRLFVFVWMMYAIVNALLILTATTDPGIVFSDAFANEDASVIPLKNSTDREFEEDFELSVPKDGIPCHICKIITPPDRKVGHCFDCGHCVEQIDHHCPWMGQCIGKHNMRYVC